MNSSKATIEDLQRQVAVLEAKLAACRRTEAEMRRIEERFRAIFDRAAIGIAILDTNRIIVDANDAYQRMLGYSNEELRALTSAQLTYPADVGQDAGPFQELVNGRREHYQLEKRFVRKDREVIWTRVTLSLVRDEDGVPRFAIGMAEDITQRKQLEEQLIRAQRLETAGRIAAQVAHDFNNLLSPLVGYPDLIQRQLPPGHPALAYCRDMQEVALQMAGINEDMLALGRRGRVEAQPTDLNQLIRQAIGQMSPLPEGLNVDLRLAPDLLPASGAQAQLLRVLSNLIGNAREAMHGRGVLTIRTENIYQDRKDSRSQSVEIGDYVRLTVQDTGCGIPEEMKERIFDAFFTSKTSSERRGCGLGLSVVKAIVDDHGGYIDLESEVGKGTTFRVYLRLSRGLPEEEVNELLPQGSETVLVVDDDRIQLEIGKRLLGSLGYRVEVASSGEEAVAYLRRQAIDLLILDMVMPDGMDGAECYRRALEVRPGQRAILLSGYAEAGLVQRAQQLGAGEFLRKPVTLERLARAVRKELDRQA